MKDKILVVDDEEDIRILIGYNLEKAGFDVEYAVNGIQGVKKAKEIKPSIILLDIMMPEMDGIEACEKIRSDSTLDNVLICFLTARGEDYSQIAGLDAGADYYITKPIKPKVLISRIGSMLRRSSHGNKPNDAINDNSANGIVLDRNKYIVMKDDEIINLPRKEFELLALLMSAPGLVFKRDEIMSKVWGDDVVVGDRTIDVHIRKLREKLGEIYFITIKGVGYKYEE